MTVVYLSLAIIVVVTTLGWLLLLQRQRETSQVLNAQQRQLLALQAELRSVNSASIGVGQRLIAIEKKLNAAIQKQQHLELSGSNLLPTLSGPVKAEQLVERYGFSEVEARLITRLLDAEPEYQ